MWTFLACFGSINLGIINVITFINTQQTTVLNSKQVCQSPRDYIRAEDKIALSSSHRCSLPNKIGIQQVSLWWKIKIIEFHFNLLTKPYCTVATNLIMHMWLLSTVTTYLSCLLYARQQNKYMHMFKTSNHFNWRKYFLFNNLFK